MEYGESYGAGDHIDIILDLRDNSIVFGKNGVFYHRHYMEKGYPYQLGLAVLYGKKANVKLLSCFKNAVSKENYDDYV